MLDRTPPAPGNLQERYDQHIELAMTAIQALPMTFRGLLPRYSNIESQLRACKQQVPLYSRAIGNLSSESDPLYPQYLDNSERASEGVRRETSRLGRVEDLITDFMERWEADVRPRLTVVVVAIAYMSAYPALHHPSVMELCLSSAYTYVDSKYRTRIAHHAAVLRASNPA